MVRVLVTSMAMLLLLIAPAKGFATEVTLKSGVTLRGRLGPRLGSVVESALPRENEHEKVDVKPIACLDDGLRRSFFPWRQADDVQQDSGPSEERIDLDQRVKEEGDRLAGIGDIVRVTPFDHHGRRTVRLLMDRGPVDLVQGITQITPVWTRLQCLVGKKAYVWDARIGTHTIPPETLRAILTQHLEMKEADAYLSVVRLFFQARRYRDARAELDLAMKKFPELADLQRLQVELDQFLAQQLFDELQLRLRAGRHLLVQNLLAEFPANNQVASEILHQVRQLAGEIEKNRSTRERVLELLKSHLPAVENETQRKQLDIIVQEMELRLNGHTIDRMADYLRLADDANASTGQKISLAISGWLLGSGAGIEDLNACISLIEARELVREYLRQADFAPRCPEILARLHALEGSSPANMARLLAQLAPPFAEQELPAEDDVAGLARIVIPARDSLAQVEYLVQVPPEYDSNRRYPALVVLHPIASRPEWAIDWWAGRYDPERQERIGEATRHGYIVIAPAWSHSEQSRYEYTVGEHAAVLRALRDAQRRFSIDTDRVFLAGHLSGGDACWDIGLSHPDLWAGVVPISAAAHHGDNDPNYINSYWENARLAAFYFVNGELDGDIISRNSRFWDQCMLRNFNILVHEYRGRGHEDFFDERPQFFEWMNRQRRDFAPRNFTVESLRTTDSFFWFVELQDYPPNTMMAPAEWYVKKSARKRPGIRSTTEAKVIEATNRIHIKTGAKRATVYLSPELVDFEKNPRVEIDNKELRAAANPNIDVMLEDARTRADRQHPFWAKLEWPEKRRGR